MLGFRIVGVVLVLIDEGRGRRGGTWRLIENISSGHHFQFSSVISKDEQMHLTQNARSEQYQEYIIIYLLQITTAVHSKSTITTWWAVVPLLYMPN